MINNLTEKQARVRALEHQIKRLQKRIAILDHRSNRIGWARVAIFFIGALLSLLTYFLVGWWLSLDLWNSNVDHFQHSRIFSWSNKQEYYASQNLDANQVNSYCPYQSRLG